MYYYFSGDYGVAIKINGIFYGTVTDTVKTLRIDGNFNPLVEILPLSENAPPVNFILDDDFLLNPPDRVCVTDLNGGYLIKFNHIFSSGEFKLIEQQKYPDAVVTIFNENGLKISLETPNDFLADTINFDADSTNIERITVCSNNFIAITLTGKKNLLVLYSLTDGIRKLFCREVDEYSVQDGLLVTTENFSDIAKHSVKSFWEFKDGEFKRTRAEVNKNQNFDIASLPEKLIPYAFFEELLAGGEIKEFLCENMAKNSDKLCGFLGNFIGVMPPPKFRKVDEVGLIYNLSKNRYKAEYFEFDLIDGKITNIKKSD